MTMIGKHQWVILTFEVAKDLPGLRLSPPGCVPQRDRRPRWICDYTYYEVNKDTINLFADDAMQFGHALERFLRQLLLADQARGPVLIMKVDISDGFYRICLNPNDIPKTGSSISNTTWTTRTISCITTRAAHGVEK